MLINLFLNSSFPFLFKYGVWLPSFKKPFVLCNYKHPKHLKTQSINTKVVYSEQSCHNHGQSYSFLTSFIFEMICIFPHQRYSQICKGQIIQCFSYSLCRFLTVNNTAYLIYQNNLKFRMTFIQTTEKKMKKAAQKSFAWFIQ